MKKLYKKIKLFKLKYKFRKFTTYEKIKIQGKTYKFPIKKY